MTYHPTDTDPDDDLDLTCPSCGADLLADETFLQWQVCGSCGRHFSVPAMDRLARIVDDGTFRALPDLPAAEDDLDNNQMSALDRLADVRERTVLSEAIVTGIATIGGNRAVVIALDDQLVGSHIGALAAEKIIVAMERALARRLPVIAFVAGGGSSGMQAGPLSIVQGQRIASMAAQVQIAGLPMIAVLSHPTSGPLFYAFASQCDVIYAEPSTTVGVYWSPSPTLASLQQALDESELQASGWIDDVVPRQQHRDRLIACLSVLTHHGQPPSTTESDGPLGSLIHGYVPLRGDRLLADDPQVQAGIAWFGDRAIAIAWQDPSVAQEANPAPALRKVQRLARLAGRFELPLLMITDAAARETPAMVSPGDSLAAAKLNATLAVLPVPVVSLGVGRIHGILANTMMTGDRRLMLHTASYHLAGDGRGSSPLGRNPNAGMSWSAVECERLGLIDEVIECRTPQDWATDPNVRTALEESLRMLERSGPRALVETRHRRDRVLGQETDAGLAAIRNELREWQDVQSTVRESIDDWRAKLDRRFPPESRPTFQRPDLGELAERLRERPSEILSERIDLAETVARLRSRPAELRQELRERAARFDRSHTDE